MATIDDRYKSEGRTTGNRWRVRYRTPDGKQRTKSFRLKRDADTFAAEVETSKHRGAFVDPSRGRVKVEAWATDWLAAKANLKPTTRERYAGILREHIVPRWGNVALADVSHAELQGWVSKLSKDRAPATVRKVHRVMSQILDTAVKDGRLARNVADAVDLPRVSSAPKRFLTHTQVDELAQLVGDDWRLVVLFLAYTGLRWGEMAALRVGRVDLERRRVHVAESVSPVAGVMTFGTPKGHLSRHVPIPRFLVSELAAAMAGKAADELVFLGPRGAVMRSQIFQHAALRDAAERMGLCSPKLDTDGRQVWRRGKDGQQHKAYTDHLTPHELRHTAASLAIAAGADVKVIQQMLGHKTATLTLDLYGHLFPDQLDAVADAMDNARASALGSATATSGPKLVHPSAADAIAFVKRHHYAGTATAGTVRHGWELDGELVAVSIYDNGNHDMRKGVFGPDYATNVLHHQRLAVAPSVPHGHTSQFLAESLRELRKERPELLAVVSYADTSVGNIGTIYQATNALYTGMATKGNLYFRTPAGEVKTTQALKDHGTWSERRKAAAAMGWTEHRSDGKHRYVYLLGSAKRGKPKLKWDVLPYPDKGGAVGVPQLRVVS